MVFQWYCHEKFGPQENWSMGLIFHRILVLRIRNFGGALYDDKTLRSQKTTLVNNLSEGGSVFLIVVEALFTK